MRTTNSYQVHSHKIDDIKMIHVQNLKLQGLLH